MGAYAHLPLPYAHSLLLTRLPEPVPSVTTQCACDVISFTLPVLFYRSNPL